MRSTIKTAAKCAAALAIIAIGIGLARLEMPPGCTSVSSNDGSVSIAISRLARGHANLFCVNDGAGGKIRFILARASDGTVHSVLDACRQCYTYRKGYHVGRNGLVCRLCGNRYSVDHMMRGKASCAPISIPHQESGGMVRISTAALHTARGMF